MFLHLGRHHHTPHLVDLILCELKLGSSEEIVEQICSFCRVFCGILESDSHPPGVSDLGATADCDGGEEGGCEGAGAGVQAGHRAARQVLGRVAHLAHHDHV